MSTAGSMELNATVTKPTDPKFTPTAQDIRATRTLLHQTGLPTELILLILDSARYWTRHTTFRTAKLALLDWNNDPHHSSAVAYLAAPVCLRPTRTGEKPKIREVEFALVSHDQGWIAAPSHGRYVTSSWFEVSIVRGAGTAHAAQEQEQEQERVQERVQQQDQDQDPPLAPPNVQMYTDVESARRYRKHAAFVPRPGVQLEPERAHCREMRCVTRHVWDGERWVGPRGDEEPGGEVPAEGTHAWYLQGNEVVVGSGGARIWAQRENAVESRVRWGCRANAVWEGNEGAGRGDGFVDALRDGDWIVLWARVKRRGWENHVYEASISIRYTIGPSGCEEVNTYPD